MTDPSDRDDLDRLLGDAFASTARGPAAGRPSLNDVHRRARRHLHRRRAGLAVGAVALVGAGGAALAARDGSSGTTAPAGAGDLDGPQATTTTMPAPTTTCVVNVATTTTDGGPADQGLSPTSTLLCGQEIADDQGQYRCEGEGRVGDDGYTYYDYCEQVWPWSDVTTTMVEYPTSTVPGSSNGSTGTTTTGPVPGSSNGNTGTTTTGPIPSSTTTPGAP